MREIQETSSILGPIMRLQHPYCVIDNAFSAEFCQRIIATGEATETMSAEVAHDPTNSVRDSKVAWLSPTAENAWLYDSMTTLVQETNTRLWNWQITMAESMQFTQYGISQHYQWHADQRRKPYPDDDSRWPSLLRMLSVTVTLADGAAFEGGDFMVEVLETPPDTADQRLKTLSEVRQIGTAVIFPSHLYHRVTPVTAGTRRSLVAWFVGPPFV